MDLGWLRRRFGRQHGSEEYLRPARGLAGRRAARTHRGIELLSEQAWTDVTWPLLAVADYDGPRWLGGFGGSDGRLESVELGHGDPDGECVRITVHRDLASLSDREDEPREGTLPVNIDGEPVTLERLAPAEWPRPAVGDGPPLESAMGAWGPYGVEISAAGWPIEGLRLVRVTDLEAYQPPPQPS